jgi:carbon-monoxide dehydrogenase large subunit
MNSAVFEMRGMSGIAGFDDAHMTIDEGGIATVWTTTPAIGQGTNTTLAQVAAEALGFDVANVRVANSDTGVGDLHGTGSFASRSAVASGGAVTAASTELRTRLLDDAADRMEAAVADLEIRDGTVLVAGSPGSAIPIGEIVADAPDDRYRFSQRWDPPQTVYPYATHACIALVDPETGGVEITDYVIVEDCGRLINPIVVEGQVHGAVTQGVAGALFEAHDYDEDGQLRTSSLMDYLVPTAAEIPAYQLTHLELPTPMSPIGVKGVGEGGTIGAAPAVANAVGDALGAEFNELPITPEKVRAVLRNA